jgi:surfactin synthase thioesterase subunit
VVQLSGVWVPLCAVQDNGSALLCLPHAGAGASAYARWADPVGSSFSIWAACLPGREHLVAEKPLSTVDDMVDRLIDELSEVDASELTIFGHCGGAIMAYELTHRLADRGDSRVARLVVSSQHCPRPGSGLGIEAIDTSRQGLANYLRKAGQTDEILLRDTEFLDYIGPVIEADIDAMVRYIRPARRNRLSVPVYAIGGRFDAVIQADQLRSWSYTTLSDFHVCQFDGTHFFLFDHERLVTEFFIRVMSSNLPPRSPSGSRAEATGQDSEPYGIPADGSHLGDHRSEA